MSDADPAIAAVRAELAKTRDARVHVAVATRAGDHASGMVEALTESHVTLVERGASYKRSSLVVLADISIVEASW